MSVSLQEVIEAGGYDLTDPEDMQWLLGTQKEYEELIEYAEIRLDEMSETASDVESELYDE